MKKGNIDESAIIKVDYDAGNIPSAVKEFKPVVFHDGNAYCCMLGSNPQEGIFGCGETPQEAINDWDNHFAERMAKPYQNDELVEYIKDTRKGNKVA